jgi:hypothetical protein
MILIHHDGAVVLTALAVVLRWLIPVFPVEAVAPTGKWLFLER